MYNYAAFGQPTPQNMNNSMVGSSNPMAPSAPMPGAQQPLQNSMPMHQAMQSPMQQSFSHGGRIKSSQFKPAHMSKHELQILDHIQGRTERTKHGVRTYPHIEELLSNPHLHAKIHEHIHHHASGGMAEGGAMDDHMTHQSIEHMIHNGRNGDNDVALLGPRTHHLFHQMAGHSTTNPDGHPEYWSLGNALKGFGSALGKHAGNAASAIGRGASAAGRGLMNAGSAAGRGIMAAGRAAAPHIGAIGNAALPAVADIASQHLGRLTGNEDVGNMLSGLGSAAAGAAFGKMAGPKEANPLATAVGQGIGQFATAKNAGHSMKAALGQGMSHVGNQAGDSTAGNLLNIAGHGLQHGMSGSDMAREMMPHAVSGGINALAAAGQHQGNLRSRLGAAANTLNPAEAMRHEARQRQQMMQELPYYGE